MVVGFHCHCAISDELGSRHYLTLPRTGSKVADCSGDITLGTLQQLTLLRLLRETLLHPLLLGLIYQMTRQHCDLATRGP
jgi:hypothetical protein